MRPFAGTAFRHIPGSSPHDIIDFRLSGQSAENRWNVQGERTLYLASDRAVAIGEFARHMRDDRSRVSLGGVIERRLIQLDLTIALSLDLRSSELVGQLSLSDAPKCFLDRSVARAVAGFLRTTTPTQALIVPSVAFLDDPSRFVVVCFLEKLPDAEQWISSATMAGTFRLADTK